MYSLILALAMTGQTCNGNSCSLKAAPAPTPVTVYTPAPAPVYYTTPAPQPRRVGFFRRLFGR